MSNKLVILFIILFFSGCVEKVKEKPKTPKTILQLKVPINDFSNLNIETKDTMSNAKYYSNLNKEISNSVKEYLQGKNSDVCSSLNNISKRLASRPISRGRERERERIENFQYEYCEECKRQTTIKNDKGEDIHAVEFSCSNVPQYTEAEWKYILKKVPNSPTIASIVENFKSANLPEQSVNSPRKWVCDLNTFPSEEILASDPLDLNVYRHDFTLEAEYCKKAVQQGQWDHIFYLSDVQSGFPQFMACINKKTQAACRCPAATIMVAKILPKAYYYDTGWLNPSADPMDVRGALQDLTKALKAATGRDLDKEPPVPEFEELFKQKPSSTSINSE